MFESSPHYQQYQRREEPVLTHEDNPHLAAQREAFMKKLEGRAEKMRGLSEITAGKEGEKELASWKAHGMNVCVRPDDPHGILRISVGGGDKTPVPLNYCTVRGNIGDCINLLERAIRALKASP